MGWIWFWIGVILLLVFLLVGFAIAQPLIFVWLNETPPRGTFDTGSMFAANIGLLALGATAVGLLVRSVLKSEAREVARKESRIWSAIAAADAVDRIAFRTWSEYWHQTRPESTVDSGLEHSTDEIGWPEIENREENAMTEAEKSRAKLHLDSAVTLALHAWSRSEDFPDNILRSVIANNLLYYLAERGNTEDRYLAENLVCVLRSRKRRRKFVGQLVGWDDTLMHAQTRWPDLEVWTEPNQEALDVIASQSEP